jgi:DNA-binding IclR family transcriptional regulator
MLNHASGGAWPSIAYVARELGLHRSTVIRALNALEARGWIRKQHREATSNMYKISFGSSG